MAFVPPAVWIATAKDLINGAAPPRSLAHCLSRPVLDGEAGCVVQDKPGHTLSAIWPEHRVGVEVEAAAGQSALATRIFNSAHWVPVDRFGCAAARAQVGLPSGPTVTGGGVLPDNTASLSVCWYSHSRLVASASVNSAGAIGSIAHPAGVTNAPGLADPPSPNTPLATAPLCVGLDKTEGVVFIAHRPGQTDSFSTAQLADCRGGQRWTNGTASVRVGEPLASALREQADFLIVYGYQAR
ncbi:MAG: hypothetical protein ACR2P2_13845 [Nakamurella sp.]